MLLMGSAEMLVSMLRICLLDERPKARNGAGTIPKAVQTNPCRTRTDGRTKDAMETTDDIDEITATGTETEVETAGRSPSALQFASFNLTFRIVPIRTRR